jgi:hypothetical protein
MFPDNRIQSITLRCGMNIFMNPTTTLRVSVRLHATCVCWLTINLYQHFLYWCNGSYPPNWVNTAIVHYSCKNWFPLTNKYCDAWVALSQCRQATENLVYLNHCISSNSSLFYGFHWTYFCPNSCRRAISICVISYIFQEQLYLFPQDASCICYVPRN